MIKDFKNKKVTIVGLGRSGFAVSLFLKDLGAEVYVTENSSNAKIEQDAQKLKSQGINVEISVHTQNFIQNKDLIVLSPGVRNDSLPVIWAEKFQTPIISEIELGSMFCKGKIIAITGTNGKTTVTTLIGKIIEASGKKVFVLGNIGTAFCQLVKEIKTEDFVSLEVSSFQLEHIVNFKPFISVILNLTRDHLDRYKNMDEYLQAKKNIFKNQDKSCWTVLNYSDPIIKELASRTSANVKFFNNHKDLVKAEKSNLNSNHLAVMAVGNILGIDEDIILDVFRNFKGVEHRLEFVEDINGVEFINDSKGTNVDSTIWALNNIRKPIILIAGGRDKNSDFTLIRNLIKEKVKFIIAIGEAKEKIKKSFGDVVPLTKIDSFQEAIHLGLQKAHSGDCVLLSPMCASFDMFSNYEERGKIFKETVRRIKQENSDA